MRISDWSSDVCSSDLHRLWNLFYFNQIASAIPGSIHSASRAARSGALHGRATDAPSWHSGSPAWQGGSYDSIGYGCPLPVGPCKSAIQGRWTQSALGAGIHVRYDQDRRTHV